MADQRINQQIPGRLQLVPRRTGEQILRCESSRSLGRGGVDREGEEMEWLVEDRNTFVLSRIKPKNLVVKGKTTLTFERNLGKARGIASLTADENERGIFRPG